MLNAVVLVPLLGAGLLLAGRSWSERTSRWLALLAGAVPVVLLAVAWWRFDPGGPRFQLVEDVDWIPSIGAGWRLGVDGIALALASMSAVLFVAALAYPVDLRGRHRQYRAWMLFLETVSLGLFLSLDLLLFYVLFDLSLVGMYFLIGRWGHSDAGSAALTFFLYTLAGSLVMLLGFLSLVLATDPLTFDMRELIARQPLTGEGTRAMLTLGAILFGLAVKTPLVPVHTWLPPAHVEAPGPGSTILAGVLLKMGVFGMIRIPLSMMGDSFRSAAPVLAGVALVSILYGSLVALAQTDLKRRIAYTSVNHMGYTVLGIAVAGAASSGEDAARRLALTGATVEMMAHGLITGSLFLIAGSFWSRTGDYDLGHYGGLAGRARSLTALTVVAAFASLGLPGLAGFVAELQIFVGAFAVYPVVAGLGLVGLLITAALFLQMIQRLFFGEPAGQHADMADLGPREVATLVVLLALVVLIGVWPAWLLDVIEPASRAVLQLTPGA